MYYAHIYRTRATCTLGRFELIITTGAAINDGVIGVTYYATKADAKRAAKLVNATPYNY